MQSIPTSLPPQGDSRPSVKKKSVSQIRQAAVLSRWDSVAQDREKWLEPFYKLPIDRAMSYLEDLRKVTESAGKIMNERINRPGSPLKCAGPRCGKDVSGTRPNGMPKWIGKKDFRDKHHPEIIHSLYFCSELCNNAWSRAHLGALGGDGK